MIQVLFTFRLLDNAHEVASYVRLTPLLNRYIAYRAKNEPSGGNPLLCCIRRLAHEIFETREVPLSDWTREESYYPRMEPVARLDVESPDCSPVEKFCSLWSPRAARNCLDNISTRKDEVSEDEYQQFVFATALRIDDLPLARSCVEKDDHFLSKLHTRWGGDMSAKTALFYPCHILAAHHGGARLLEYLLTVTAGTSPVNKSMRSMLLRFAARWGRVDIVKFLYDFQKEEAPWDLDDWRSKDCQDLQEAQKTSSLQVLNFVQDKLLRSFPSFGRRLKLETPLVTAARQNRLDTIAHIIRREPAIGGRCCRGPLAGSETATLSE